MSRSAPPTHAHGSAIAMIASAYHLGPNSGPRPGPRARRRCSEACGVDEASRSCPLSPLALPRRQQLGELVVALGDSTLHGGLDDGVAGLRRLVAHGGRKRGLAALLDEGGRDQRLTGVPGA